MLTDKPFMIAPKTDTPDYAGYVRRTLTERLGERGSFAQALKTQQASPQAAERQTSASAGQAAASGRDGESAPARQPGLPLGPRVPGGLALRRTGGLSLDQRSLSVLQDVGRGGKVRVPAVKKATGETVAPGRLSARYESGTLGAAAIGYDRNGGTSYGKYQISSRQGTFQEFLQFLDGTEPGMAQRLRKAGPANTGTTRGAVPEVWRAIAAESPERFEQLQEAFIRDSHYNPALESVREVLGVQEISPTLQEVLWSTAVQHGPAGAKRLFSRAAANIAAAGGDPKDEKALIDTVYTLRKGQFASSAPSVQAAVRRRFDDERSQALAMLREKTLTA